MKYIFCINSGRSGSHYLADVLGTAEQICSYREAPPQMAYQYVTMANKFPLNKTRAQRLVKIKDIKSKVANNPKDYTYSETNHMFIKTFYDLVMETFKSDVNVIILRRKLSKVLKSFIELGYFGKNQESLNWMTLPFGSNSIIKLFKPYRDMDQFERCISYLLDIEYRALEFKKQYKNINICEANIDLINDFDYTKELFNNLGINTTLKTSKILGQVINSRPDRKKHFNNPTTIDVCKRKIERYINLAHKNNIIIPETIIL